MTCCCKVHLFLLQSTEKNIPIFDLCRYQFEERIIAKTLKPMFYNERFDEYGECIYHRQFAESLFKACDHFSLLSDDDLKERVVGFIATLQSCSNKLKKKKTLYHGSDDDEKSD